MARIDRSSPTGVTDAWLAIGGGAVLPPQAAAATRSKNSFVTPIKRAGAAMSSRVVFEGLAQSIDGLGVKSARPGLRPAELGAGLEQVLALEVVLGQELALALGQA